jgi:hypothetical protein
MIAAERLVDVVKFEGGEKKWKALNWRPTERVVFTMSAGLAEIINGIACGLGLAKLTRVRTDSYNQTLGK